MSSVQEYEDDNGEVIVAKVVAMVVLFLATMVFGNLPLVLAKRMNWVGEGKSPQDIKNNNRVIVMLLSFGGGALLCTTFQHVLPEVSENVDSLTCKGVLPEMKFHLASLLMCIGFFTMYFVEELVHLYLHSRSKKTRRTTDSALVRSLSIRKSQSASSNSNARTPTISTSDLISKDPEKPSISTVSGHSHAGHSHSHFPTAESANDDPVIASLRGLLIVLALSIHELFEGLAVGLESTASDVWYMFGAVSAHKLVIAFCVGVELVTTKTKTWLAVVYILTFAVVSPIGIGVGLGLSGGEGAAASGLPSVILQGLASGTLLYVVFFEILQRDRSGFIQFFFALIGFLVMFGLQFIAHHEHGDDEECVHSHDHDHEHEHRH